MMRLFKITVCCLLMILVAQAGAAQTRPDQGEAQSQPEDDDLAQLEDARLIKELESLADEPLNDSDKENYKIEWGHARRVDVASEITVKIDELLKDARESHKGAVKKTYNDAQESDDENRSRYRSSRKPKDKSLVDLSKEIRQKENSHADYCRALNEVRNYAEGLKKAAAGFAESAVHVKYRQNKRFLRSYRMSLRLMQNSLPSPAKLDVYQQDIERALDVNNEIALVIKGCLDEHEDALKQIAASKPCLCSQVLASSDGTYWRINSVLKMWIGDRKLVQTKWDVYDVRRRNIHVKAIATAWAKTELNCAIPDVWVEVACKWLDAYTPDAELIVERESAYQPGATRLRERQAKLK